jgi:hypothetical protein
MQGAPEKVFEIQGVGMSPTGLYLTNLGNRMQGSGPIGLQVGATLRATAAYLEKVIPLADLSTILIQAGQNIARLQAQNPEGGDAARKSVIGG